MGKRKDFGELRPRDFYPTVDPDAVRPLIPFIKGLTYAEPCCGDGSLVRLLEDHVGCFWASDLEPKPPHLSEVDYGFYEAKDAVELTPEDLKYCKLIITNPPFSWGLLQPLLDHLPLLKPTWLLLPTDVCHNKRMSPYLRYCSKIVSIGRLFWFDNKVKGVDNYVWMLFDYKQLQTTVFYGRT